MIDCSEVVRCKNNMKKDYLIKWHSKLKRFRRLITYLIAIYQILSKKESAFELPGNSLPWLTILGRFIFVHDWNHYGGLIKNKQSLFHQGASKFKPSSEITNTKNCKRVSKNNSPGNTEATSECRHTTHNATTNRANTMAITGVGKYLQVLQNLLTEGRYSMIHFQTE